MTNAQTAWPVGLTGAVAAIVGVALAVGLEDVVGALDDVVVGQHIAITGNNEARPQRLGLALAVAALVALGLEMKFLRELTDRTAKAVFEEAGDSVDLQPILLVDGSTVTSDADKLAKVSVTGEIVEHTKGPKIRIHKFKNKTGYHKRQGHRQKLTVLKVTGIK